MLSIPIHCPDGYGMRGWRFRSEMGQEGFFEFECVPILPSACELLRSSCELFTNLTTFVDALANWARPCGPNRYFRGWLLAVCSSSGVTVRNTCCDLPSGWTARNKQMPVRVPGAEASVARMDAWDTKRLGPMCPPSSVMMGWERDYLSASGDVGLTYSCASEPSGLCTLGTLPPPSAGVAIGRTNCLPTSGFRNLVGVPLACPGDGGMTRWQFLQEGADALFEATCTHIQTVVLRQVACAELSTDAEDDLDFIVHPLGFSIRGSQEAGAIVGNTLVAAAFALVFYLEAYVVWLMAPSNTKAAQTAQTQQHAEKAAVDDNTQAPLWTLACAIVRFPSVAYFPALFLLPGTLECSVTLLAEAGHDLLFLSLACVGVALCVGFPAHLFFQPNGTLTEAAVVEVEHVQKSGFGRARGAVARYILGKDAWVSTNEAVLYVERDGMLFDSYRELRWLKGRHFVIELAITYPLAALAFTQTRTFTTCSIKAFVLATLFLAQSVLMVYFDVFLSPFLQHLTLATNVTMTIGLMLLATAYLRESLLGTHFDTAIGFLTGAMVLALIRAVFDAFVFWHDIYCCWRKANRETSRPGLFSTLAFRATFRCKRLAERRSAPLQPSASDPSRKSSTRTGQSPSQSSEPSVSLNPLASQSAGKLARDDTEDGWDAHSAASGLSLETG
eukprot:gene1136-1743_t